MTSVARDAPGPEATVFDVPGLNGAAGVRVSSLDWLWIHPTGEAPYADLVFLVFGDVVVQMAVTVPETGRDDPQAIELRTTWRNLALG